MNVHQKIGIMVRDYRKKRKITQLDLAKKLGYSSPQFVSLFERGLCKIPLETLGQLIIILNLPEKTITQMLFESYENQIMTKIKEGISSSSQAQNSKNKSQDLE